MRVGGQPDNLVGERFIKVDLHTHTPESKCYSDPLTTPEQVVDAALAAGLEAIAVTDHNTVRGLDRVRELAQEKGLAVFPAVELSARGGHVLALFDQETPIPRLDDFLDYVGVSAAGKGDGSITISDWIEDVFRKIDEWGGIAIAAHIERWPTGFLQTTERRRVKMRIHSNPYLTALEITQPQNKGLWNKGQARDYPKKYACIQGSDAHALDEVGRRATYLRIPSLDLKGLRLAFNDYEIKIRFPEEMVGKG
jgi:PHP family Zn ribbon phosphoesterase